LARGKDQKTIVKRRRVDATNATAETQRIGADEVAAYLRRHPDFLVEHPELLGALTPPALQRGDSVVDMQHFMLQRLRSDPRATEDAAARPHHHQPFEPEQPEPHPCRGAGDHRRLQLRAAPADRHH